MYVSASIDLSHAYRGLFDLNVTSRSTGVYSALECGTAKHQPSLVSLSSLVTAILTVKSDLKRLLAKIRLAEAIAEGRYFRKLTSERVWRQIFLARSPISFAC